MQINSFILSKVWVNINMVNSAKKVTKLEFSKNYHSQYFIEIQVLSMGRNMKLYTTNIGPGTAFVGQKHGDVT